MPHRLLRMSAIILTIILSHCYCCECYTLVGLPYFRYAKCASQGCAHGHMSYWLPASGLLSLCCVVACAISMAAVHAGFCCFEMCCTLLTTTCSTVSNPLAGSRPGTCFGLMLASSPQLAAGSVCHCLFLCAADESIFTVQLWSCTVALML